MPDPPPQTPGAPRTPKLRSSCDRCGAAKLKCDRGRPQCGRCIPLGLKCVYGVSRKMGKPARERLYNSEITANPRRSDENTGSTSGSRLDDHKCNSGATGSVSDDTIMSSGPFSSVNSVPSAWSAGDGDNISLQTSVDGSDVLRNDLSGSTISNFTSLDFYRDLLDTSLQTGPLSTFSTPNLDDFSNSGARSAASQTQIDPNVFHDSASLLNARSGDHDCSREAYDILGSLSLLNLNKTHGIPGSATRSAPTTVSTTPCVPFDLILRLNRESGERLGRLLTCYCARSPPQALLYASIISMVLTWYEEAAGCRQKPVWSPSTTAADTVSSHGSPYGSQSPWSTAAGDVLNLDSLDMQNYTKATSFAVAPTHIAMGSFNIDDEQVQAALRIQVLLGEVKRTGSLIDLYRSSSGVDEATFSSVDGLYKSLSSWLRKEHSRIADVMRSRLIESST